MRLTDWAHKLMRSLPYDFTGEIVFRIEEGRVMKAWRNDEFTESIFYRRFREFAPDGSPYGNSSIDGGAPERRPPEQPES